VPVPSRPHCRRRRGADVGLLLARHAARELRAIGWPAAVAPLLRHRARSVDQAGLGRDERLRNVAGTLVARRRPVAREACASIVVDDIVTTGATLDEAFRALDGAGWPMLGGAVVAATPGKVTPLEVAPEGV
jgi:predicted amidophosphoribosyltransferase